MKRLKSEPNSARRCKLPHLLLGIAALYLIFLAFKFPHFLEIAAMLSGDDSYIALDGTLGKDGDPDISRSYFGAVYKDTYHRRLEDDQNQNAPTMSIKEPLEDEEGEAKSLKPLQFRYGRITGEIMKRRNRTADFSMLEKMADEAWTLGLKAWKEVEKYDGRETGQNLTYHGKSESCPVWVSMTGDELAGGHNIMFLPCGLAAGSSITVVGTPHNAHREYVPQLARTRTGDGIVMVSQFMIELQGLNSVDGEDPPKILHLNPRLRGDWSRQPIIEHNTCYRMQWGSAQRCDGLPSKKEEDMLELDSDRRNAEKLFRTPESPQAHLRVVDETKGGSSVGQLDGFVRCEKWMRNDIVDSKESKTKTTSWFKRFIGRAKKPEMTWPFPFAEGRLFILTVRAGVDGFHIIVGGRHVTSFPYRPGFTLEEATGLAVKGELDVHSVYATSLPVSHPSFSPKKVMDMSKKWKAPALPKGPIQVFIGILSATNHFAERMAVRKTWMQSPAIKSSNVAVRFFVALNPRKEVNAELKKEAAYFGDIVVLPFMDRYELVVLKTIAICEFGVQNVSADYVMKCDDDTFVRVDRVLKEIDSVAHKKSLYMGNLNFLHRPLRTGKWAVTFEEWPESVYPPYANGPGYIISNDIAKYIVAQHDNKNLKLFKMEDVSMGMWVGQFNSSKPVHYSHNWKFCQYGCMEDYFTAHYQSPRQMICLWDKLLGGHAHCCNSR